MIDRVDLVIAACVIVLISAMVWVFYAGHLEEVAQNRAHHQYCESRGYHVYTAWGRKCVDDEGHERLIPDDYWASVQW